MIEYQTVEYQDIDGNRGITVWNYELEDNDADEIRSILLYQAEGYEYGDTVEIEMLSHYTDEIVTFKVASDEYITEEEYKRSMTW